MKPIHTLLVEKDPSVLFYAGQAIRNHENYILVDTLGEFEEALERISVVPVDLLVLGVPYRADGWQRCVEARRGMKTILLVSSPSVEMVDEAIDLGVWDIQIRPVTTERLRLSLEVFRFHNYHRQLLKFPLMQDHLDPIFFPRDNYASMTTSVGRNGEMLEKIVQVIEEKKTSLSAGEIAQELQVSRITVRKYCETLVSAGRLSVKNKYQMKGRPIKKYSVA